MKKNFIIGCVISLIFLILAVNKVKINEVQNAFCTANYFYFILAVLFTIMGCWVRAVRWKYLLYPVKKIHASSTFKACMIGMMANNLLPARLGDLVKAYTIGKMENISKSASFGTVIIERVFDGLTLLLFLFIAFIFHDFHAWVKKIGMYAFLFYLGVIIFLIIAVKYQDKSFAIISKILRPFSHRLSSKITATLNKFVKGFTAVNDKKIFLLVTIYSIINWTFIALAVYSLFYCFDLHLRLGAAFVTLVIVTLGIMIPAAPGSVGTFQYFCIAAIGLFGISDSIGLSFSILFHASQFLPTTIIGLLYLWKENFSFNRLKCIGYSTRPATTK